MAEEKIDPRKHRGFVGGEFAVTAEPTAETEAVLDTEGTVDTGKPESTELHLDVESRLAAIHNPENQ